MVVKMVGLVPVGFQYKDMGVSQNNGKTTKSSHFNRVFHEINHPFWGTTIFGNTHMLNDLVKLFIANSGKGSLKGSVLEGKWDPGYFREI